MSDTSDPKNDRPADQADDDYRDDPNEMGQSSDYAQHGTPGRYSGNGPDETPSQYDDAAPGKGNNAGSQADWRGGPAADGEPKATDENGELQSRSADPGQGSYGGFKNEGPGPGGDHEAAKPDDKP